MGVVKVGLRSLVVSAGVALVLLTAFSELTPQPVDLFKDAMEGSEVSVECIVIQCNQSKSGHIITAMDKGGEVASIYLSPSVLAASVPAGSVIRVVLTPSEDDPSFMFASFLEISSEPFVSKDAA